MKTLTFFLLSTVLSGALGCCLFNGTEYGVGDQIPGICFNLYCKFNGTHTVWVPGSYFLNGKCAKCRVSDDPHFTTFDNDYYHWHGICNYTISQPLECRAPWGYNPAYAIYGDFRQCGTASCVHTTTYKANEYTAIEIVHSEFLINYKIKINGKPEDVQSTPQAILPYQIIAWHSSNYIYIQGPDFSMQIYERFMYIWTTPDHLKQLGGLCGYYSGVNPDDHTGRDGTVHDLSDYPDAFPESWKTNQHNPDCPAQRLKLAASTTRCLESAEDKERCTNVLERSLIALGKLRWVNLLNNCMADLCRDSGNKDKWLKNIANIAQAELLNDKLTAPIRGK